MNLCGTKVSLQMYGAPPAPPADGGFDALTMMAHWTLCVPHVAFPSFASDAWISVHFSGVGKQLARPACPPDRQSSVRMSAGTAQQKHTRSGCNFISFCPAPPPDARQTSRAIVKKQVLRTLRGVG